MCIRDSPWAAPRTLTPAQRNRYQRHLLLPEIGEVGQLKPVSYTHLDVYKRQV